MKGSGEMNAACQARGLFSRGWKAWFTAHARGRRISKGAFVSRLLAVIVRRGRLEWERVTPASSYLPARWEKSIGEDGDKGVGG